MRFEKLGQIVEQIRGVSYSSDQVSKESKKGYVPLLRANAINNGKINYEDLVFVPTDIVRDKQFLLPGDILIATSSGSLSVVGKAAQVVNNDKLTFGAFCKVLRPSNAVDKNYFAHFFKTNFYANYIQKCAEGANINNLKNEHFDNLTIPLPTMKEQMQIATVLDKAQSNIDKRKQAIAKLDELIQAVFLDMFGDPVTNSKNLITISLGELGEWKSGGTPSRGNKEYFKGNIPWYTSGELNDLYVNGCIEYITEAALKETSTKEVPIGALLLGMYDTAALKSSITTKRSSCNQAIAFAKINESLAETKYVYYAVQLGKEHYKSIQRGVRQKNLNLSMIKAIKILYPSLKLQKDFVRIADIIYLKKQQMKLQLQHLESNFQALLQNAFKGELKVKDGVEV